MSEKASQDHLVDKLVKTLEIPKKLARKAVQQSRNETEALTLAQLLYAQEKTVERLITEFPILTQRDRRLVEFLVEQNNGNYSHSLWALKRALLAKRFEEKYSKV